MEAFSAVKITERIWWVGAIDWEVRNFHGYQTGRGTTYNAYLAMGEKITLFDTVKRPFKDQMLARIASVVDPSRIDYIVSNHSEMDHSGSLPEVMDAVKPEKVFASSMGVKALREHFHFDENTLTELKDGSTLDLGGMSATFLETRMVHWPDSMVAYIPEEKALISQDAFGMHLASSERFADDLPEDVLAQESLKYYANILMPYSKIIGKTIDKLLSLGLDVSTIMPDHGPVWRRDPLAIVKRYREWTELRPGPKAVVVYDTMWHSTESVARAVTEGLAEGGMSVREMSLSASHRSDVATELMGASALVVGSPTINNQMFPTVADCLTYLKGLKPANMVGAAFGSFGWSGESPKLVAAELQSMKLPMAAEPLAVKYVPDKAALVRAREFGRKIAAEASALLKGTCCG